jgi:hypothetical protein
LNKTVLRPMKIILKFYKLEFNDQEFLKRQPSEKWHNGFNPFLLSIFKSNMDIQFITEEYSCAAYVVEYVNKTNSY